MCLCLEENLAHDRFLILYNVVVGNILLFVVDVNLAPTRFLTLQCCYMLVFLLKGNPTHVIFSFTLQSCYC